MTSTQLAPALIIPFIAWRVYVRVRRTIGPQRYHPGRIIASIVVFSVITLGIAVATLGTPPSLAALGGGLLLSVPLAWFGLHLTRFETTPNGKFYTPNTAIGLALTILFVGRMGYRVLVLFVFPPADQMPPPPFQSPLTLLMYGVTAGYYIAYGAGVLVRGKSPATG